VKCPASPYGHLRRRSGCSPAAPYPPPRQYTVYQNLTGKGGQFWVVARGHFSVGITTWGPKPGMRLQVKWDEPIIPGQLTMMVRLSSVTITVGTSRTACGQRNRLRKGLCLPHNKNTCNKNRIILARPQRFDT